MIFSLDDQPALEVLKQDIGPDLADDLPKIAGRIFAALPVPGSDTGDYLVRNLIGIDTNNELVAIGDTVGPGDSVMFCKRDRTTAVEDMPADLRRVRGNAVAVMMRKTCDLPVCNDVLKTRAEDRPASEFHLLEEPRLNWLGRYWSDLRGWADIPKRRHLDPLDIRHDVLPWIFLIERRDDGFWYRLSGSGHRAATGKELTGRTIEETTDNPAFNAHLSQLFRTSATRRRPFYSKDKLVCGPVTRLVERVVLPLSDTDNCATSLLVAQLEKAPVIDEAFAATSPSKLVRRYMFYQRAEAFEPVAVRELYL